MNAFDHAWQMTTEHHRVSATVRVTIQTRAVNVYTYVEDLVPDGGGPDLVADGHSLSLPSKHWRIRPGTVRAHGDDVEGRVGPNPRLKAKARAETLWHELKQREFVMAAASAS